MNGPIQPAIPHHHGRRPHELSYGPVPPAMQHAQAYHTYRPPPHHNHLPNYYHPNHHHQWYAYQQMQTPIARQYQQYPMMPAPYPMPHVMSPMPHRPHPPLHVPSTSSVRSQADVTSSNSPSIPLHAPPAAPPVVQSPQLPPPAPPPSETTSMRFYPPLPWYSVRDEPFPSHGRRRQRRKLVPQSLDKPVEFLCPKQTLQEFEFEEDDELPDDENASSDAEKDFKASECTLRAELAPEQRQMINDLPVSPEDVTSISEDEVATEIGAQDLPNLETPITSHTSSEIGSTQPTTPSSAIAPHAAVRGQPAHGSSKSQNRPAIPLLPIVPAVPIRPSTLRPSQRISPSPTLGTQKPSESLTNGDHLDFAADAALRKDSETRDSSSEQAVPASLPSKPPPKSWADLVRSKVPAVVPDPTKTPENTTTKTDGFPTSKAGSLSQVLSTFAVNAGDDDSKIAFLKPRGLINTGNMCYMNAVLQILVFCVPFYNFVDKVGKRAAHNFKSDTPLVDAMIMFLREFPVIDSAVSIDLLRLRLKDSELEVYGDPFVPEYVYEVIRRVPRFASMRRGHQQDAEEFLGFLLEEMHDECAKAMRSAGSKIISNGSTPTNGTSSPETEREFGAENGWLEVGPRQKASITRFSGTISTESPVTKIFGGKFRSELRIPGLKNSVISEPYQPLQLDIGSPYVSNITDALKGLTRSEVLHGDFNSPRGPGVTATKQVFIETLPPVLILHLKRFQYNNAGGTQKIWKKIGYPLELEIPKEVFPPHKRGGLAVHGGLPKYRLIGVIYHHGKNASGGHYTVDVRRQEGREWIRLDDTVIRRIRSDDVAEGGSEEDPKVLAAALEQHKKNSPNASTNIFDRMRSEQEEEEAEEKAKADKGWSQVNGNSAPGSAAATGKKSNGVTTPASPSGKRTPVGRSTATKDNKVAYLLFYQKITL